MDKSSDTLDELTPTFSADRQFFDDLLAHPSGEAFVEMSVWYLWLHEYLHDIQDSLHDAGKQYGKAYQVWIVSMIGGVAHCLGMLMYLIARGVVNEAGASARRALEYVGMAAHLINDPAKAQFLNTLAEADSKDFKRAFIRGKGDEGERLKDRGIAFRFAGMSEPVGKAVTRLYDVFSRFNVHGGTMTSLVSVSVVPTPHSCAFHNRSIDQVAENVALFKPIMELTAIELVRMVGTKGTPSQRVAQAGA